MTNTNTNTNEKEEKINIYSNHVFIFPFTIDVTKWNDKNKKSFSDRVNIDNIDNLLDKNLWKEKKTISEFFENEQRNDEEKDLLYNNYNYFYENVRYALFNEKNHDYNIFKEYEYNKKNGKYTINIEKNDENDKIFEQREYILNVLGISLKIYETGVGLLSFALENTNYNKYEDILYINDYGRRIYPQFLPLKKVKNNFLPNKVELEFDDGTVYIENFNKYKHYRELKLSNIIIQTLGGMFVDQCLSCNKNCSENSIVIKPLIDDRMYTICWYKNTNLIKLFEKDLYCDEWYKYLYLDTSSSSVCDYDMKKKLIDDCTYTRWINRGKVEARSEETVYGTLYGLTRYSFMVISDEGDYANDVIRNHCLNQYFNLSSLLLLQRASILRFSNEVSEISMLNSDNDLTNKINELYKHYIRFINQLYFREITAQEQGIELYRIGLQIMNIENEVKALDEEIQELHQYGNFIISEVTNDKLNKLTYSSFTLGFASFLAGYLGMNIFELGSFKSWSSFIECPNSWISLGIFAPVLLSIVILIIGRKK